MSQQAGPHGEQPTIDYRIPARSGEPEIASDPIPLKDRVTLYFHHLETDSPQIQQLVYLKTLRETGARVGDGNCDIDEQQRIIAEAERVSKDDHHPWEWTYANIGRYIASGLTQPNDLESAIGLSAEEIEQVIHGGEVFLPPDHAAILRDTELYKGANERILQNRNWFKERAEKEDQTRHAEQAKHAQSTQVNRLTAASQSFLVGRASKQLGK